ncbi:OLC1v1031322C1 [Oldenlandia corymbosa var. corymbosa]|uniref:OLC1v1031322C1 n=1 Tax=Oldenlandia corymbosa var. corymbosa TaxID=529605 RepID=A0AAV1CL33_OLDCO|nr:OLC1v1031322C1 [Oldenlandia corymbosa var. corymbosa]
MSSNNQNISTGKMVVENISCRKCGRKATLLPSGSADNQGRLYYRCPLHGWLKWFNHTNTESNSTSQGTRRRFFIGGESDGGNDQIRMGIELGSRNDEMGSMGEGITGNKMKLQCCKCRPKLDCLLMVVIAGVFVNVMVLLLVLVVLCKR